MNLQCKLTLIVQLRNHVGRSITIIHTFVKISMLSILYDHHVIVFTIFCFAYYTTTFQIRCSFKLKNNTA